MGSERATLGNGRINGQLDFHAQDLHRWDDLSAKLEATLSQTQALALPVLHLLGPYLAPGGRLDHFRERRSYRTAGSWRGATAAPEPDQPALQLILVGTITLSSRVDLEVHAHSGDLALASGGVKPLHAKVPEPGSTAGGGGRQGHRCAGPSPDSPAHHGRSAQSQPAAVETPLPLTEEAIRYFMGR